MIFMSAIQASLDNLPIEMYLEIIKHLNLKDVKSLRQTNIELKKSMDNIFYFKKEVNHPLISDAFIKNLKLNVLVTALFIAFTSKYDETAKFLLGASLVPLTWICGREIYWLPTMISTKICGQDEAGMEKASKLSPLIGITLFTLTAYGIDRRLPSTFLLKGLVWGIHAIAMSIFTLSPPAASTMMLYSLTTSFKSLIPSIDNLPKNLKTRKVLDNISYQSTQLSIYTAVAIGCIALKICSNPIVSTTAAFSLSSVVKLISMRVLTNQFITQEQGIR